MPRVYRHPEGELEHTFAWSFILEPQQRVDLFGEGTPMPPGGVHWDHKSNPPYVRFQPGAYITALGCSTPEAIITLVVGYRPRSFAGPWLTHPERSKLDVPIKLSHEVLTGAVTSSARVTQVVHVWLRTHVLVG